MNRLSDNLSDKLTFSMVIYEECIVGMVPFGQLTLSIVRIEAVPSMMVMEWMDRPKRDIGSLEIEKAFTYTMF
jgi:hypothetical protein